jgi:hypothetical protein
MRRTARIGVLVLSLLGVIGALAPTPAEATTVGAVVFNGNAVVSGHGIAYPLAGSNTGEIDLFKLPPTFFNSASVVFTSKTCAAAAFNITKAGKLPVEAGTCTIAAVGSVHGYCGLSDGHLSGTVSVSVVGSGTQEYSFHLSWISVASKLILSGYWHKHGTIHSGVLKGIVSAKPDTFNIKGQGASSCLNKHQKVFLVTGGIVLGSTTSPTPTSLPPKPSLKSPST